MFNHVTPGFCHVIYYHSDKKHPKPARENTIKCCQNLVMIISEPNFKYKYLRRNCYYTKIGNNDFARPYEIRQSTI